MIIALVLLSAFLHALWNALLRLEDQKERALVVAITVATLFAAVVTAVRWGLGEVPFVSVRGVEYTIAAGMLEAIYFATLARAMELGTLGVVYTISRGGAVLVVWPLSMVLFGEVATLGSLMGSTVVIAGLALSGLGSRRGGAGGAAGGSNPRAAIGWASVCAVSIAGYHLAYAAALREGTNPSACFALSLAVSVVINGTRLSHGHGAEIAALVRRRWPRLLVMGLISGGSFLILIEALARGEAGYVLTVRNMSVLFALIMAWRIGDRPGRAEIAGAALVAAGVSLMAR